MDYNIYIYIFNIGFFLFCYRFDVAMFTRASIDSFSYVPLL